MFIRIRFLFSLCFLTFGEEDKLKVVDVFELENVKGGVSGWVLVGVAAFIVFLAGVFEGITNPSPCEK